MFTSFSLPDDPAWKETRQQAGHCQGEGRHVKVLVWRLLDSILQKYHQRVLIWRLLDSILQKYQKSEMEVAPRHTLLTLWTRLHFYRFDIVYNVYSNCFKLLKY